MECCHRPFVLTHVQPSLLSPPREWHVCYRWWTHADTSLSPKVHCSQLVHTCVGHSVVLDKCVMTCAPVTVSYREVPLPRKSSVCYLATVPLTTFWPPFCCLYNFALSRVSELESYRMEAFLIAFFLWAVYTQRSPCLVHGWIDHSFLALSNIPLSIWSRYLSSHLLKSMLVVPQVW
jgi:hypothetical protein